MQAAAVEHLGAAAAEILFAAIEQSGRHFGLGAIGPHQHHAGHARLGGNPALVGIRTEAGVREPDRLAVVPGQEQAAVVEIELGEDQLLQQVGRDRLQQPRLAGAAPPQGGQHRRIGIAKRAVRQHERLSDRTM